MLSEVHMGSRSTPFNNSKRESHQNLNLWSPIQQKPSRVWFMQGCWTLTESIPQSQSHSPKRYICWWLHHWGRWNRSCTSSSWWVGDCSQQRRIQSKRSFIFWWRSTHYAYWRWSDDLRWRNEMVCQGRYDINQYWRTQFCQETSWKKALKHRQRHSIKVNP